MVKRVHDRELVITRARSDPSRNVSTTYAHRRVIEVEPVAIRLPADDAQKIHIRACARAVRVRRAADWAGPWTPG